VSSTITAGPAGHGRRSGGATRHAALVRAAQPWQRLRPGHDGCARRRSRYNQPRRLKTV
jgi:hypothetical protein